jgi:hypothetical protein
MTVIPTNIIMFKINMSDNNIYKPQHIYVTKVVIINKKWTYLEEEKLHTNKTCYCTLLAKHMVLIVFGSCSRHKYMVQIILTLSSFFVRISWYYHVLSSEHKNLHHTSKGSWECYKIKLNRQQDLFTYPAWYIRTWTESVHLYLWPHTYEIFHICS